jgi:hypothetical protein
MRLRCGVILAFLLFSPSSYSEDSILFCDLLRNPGKYDGKEVIVRATWRYGFEWSQFYCIDCSTKEMTWLKISSDLDDESSRVLKHIPKAGVVNITVEGVFQSHGHFGHLNGYPNQFIARKVRKAAVVSKGMRSPADEQSAEKKWACGAKNPK